MSWYKIEDTDVFFNGLTSYQVGCVVKYRCLCQHIGVEELNERQLKNNFSWKERQFLIQHFSLSGQNQDKVRTTLEQNRTNSGQIQDKVGNDLGQSWDKVGNFSDNKNKDLAYARIDNNINNTIKEEKEKKEIKKENTKRKKSFSNEFEEWWKECPKKVSKDDAFRKFNTILAGNIATFDELMAGIKRYSEHCREENTENHYIKHPSTWLNQGCWKDEYKSEKRLEWLDEPKVKHNLDWI